MLKFIHKEFRYLYLAFFDPLLLDEETKKFPKKKSIIFFLKTYSVATMVALLIFFLTIEGGECVNLLFNINFLNDSFRGYKIFIVFLIIGLCIGVLFCLFFGFYAGFVIGLFIGLLLGGFVGLFVSIASWLFLGLFFGAISGLSGKIPFSLIAVLLGWGLENSFNVLPINYYFLAFLFGFSFLYFRPFYLIPHLWQYWHYTYESSSLVLIKNSPVYWDKMIRMPLPFLEEWLIGIVKKEYQQGLDEIFFIIRERPLQRKAAFKALVVVVGWDLQEINSISRLAILNDVLAVFPSDDKALPTGLQDTRKQLNNIANIAMDYQNRQTHVGQLNVLNELVIEMTKFRTIMRLTAAPVGTAFETLATKWLNIIKAEQESLYKQFSLQELSNPYVAGSPLQERDNTMFVGRRDILLAIEKYILNTEQSPSLLLYGRRRTGKSSTLLNLPRSRFEPVYIDCQDAKWHESDQAFCYNLAHDLFNVLYQSDSVRGLRQPQIEQFDKNAFTQLDQFLTQAQKIAEQRGKRILLAFDEYEELENSIINGDISEKVLGKLRNLIQHSKSIVVLVSGSHRFEELTRLNWANYLINTRTLELSYLDAESARELLTKPVPELHYAAGVVDDIIRITHCQPYLLQAVASELVNYLNSKQQTTATPDDLNTALEKTLVSASAYFSDTWRKDNSATEQQVMRALATGKTESVLADAAFLPAIQSLIRKEIVEGTEGSYRLAVELFARWIVKNQV
ncbi:MAG: hypothetical protein L3K52_08315 [Candidatus Thiothrix sulfatifontis]|nr:MAG: hypothetical protein L3K52_08315 [Candidatus Thiothrix sulfatifontis]